MIPMAFLADSPHCSLLARNIGLPSKGVPNQGWKLYVTSLVMIIFAGLIVIARCATRVASKKFGSDDYTIVASLVFSMWLSVMIHLAVVNGYGMHEADLTNQELSAALMFFWIAQTPYKVVVCLNKISVVLFSKRIFTTKRFLIASWCTLAIVIGWGLGALGATIFQCIPARGSWDANLQASCIDKKAFWIAYAVGNVVTDAIVLILPLPMVFQLQLKLRDKFLITGIYLLGGFVLICSIVRTTVVSNSLSNQQDTTWYFIPRGIWTVVEANMGTICACLPLMKQTVSRLRSRTVANTSGCYSFGGFLPERDTRRGVYSLEENDYRVDRSTLCACNQVGTDFNDDVSSVAASHCKHKSEQKATCTSEHDLWRETSWNTTETCLDKT